ncbi:hypothetical protein CALVIDRAFT_525741 [Calocera viscosa TUFC12733]|uniref:Integrase core domain-containing protein n=1 Tax=Calocera viscosa (strain TUFC12733) TaxID=1330018 RepID=A0A167PF43_CALVF|nr:hypothetical protein CALVIDRAFT_525741 [Calocera viscosa TUFC12733]
MDERRENQYDRAVPDTILRPLVEKYFSYGFGDKKILRSITKEIDLESNRWTLSHFATISTKKRYWSPGESFNSTNLWLTPLDVDNGVLGLHESWSFDQHDKWRRFGLWLHCGLEGFSNFVLWLKIWWTNSNPRLIASFYFEAATRLGGIPMLTWSDPGTENHGIANAQTTLRRQLDLSLQGMLQHEWMRGHSNIKPEIFWSKLRKQSSPGWEILFDEGLEQGCPMNMDLFCDYKVATLFAPPEHEVFQLVPERFEKQAKTLFDELGHPAVDRESFWAIYLMMLEGFMSLPEAEAVALWEDMHSNEAREETIQPRGAGEDPSRAGSNDESLSEPGDEDDVPTVDMTPHV